MSCLLDVLLCGLTVISELITVVMIGLLIQLFFYRILKINLYKKIEKLIMLEVK